MRLFFLILFLSLEAFTLMVFGFNTNSWCVDFVEFCLAFVVLRSLRIKDLNAFGTVFSHPS